MTDKEIKFFLKFLKETNTYGQFKKVLRNDCYTDISKTHLNFCMIKHKLRYAHLGNAVTALISPDVISWNSYKNYTVKDVNIPKHIEFYSTVNLNSINWKDILNMWYNYYTHLEGKEIYKFFKELIESQNKYLYLNTKTNNIFKFELTDIDTDKVHSSRAVLTSSEITKNMTIKKYKAAISTIDSMYIGNASFNYFLKTFEPITIENAKNIINKYRDIKLKKLENEFERCNSYLDE